MMLNDDVSGLTLGEDYVFLLGGSYVVYHCPFCGGLLPDNSKPIWFPRLTEQERDRLQHLIDGITTEEEAIQRLGPPDYASFIYAYKQINSESVVDEDLSKRQRNVEYYNLSEHANIEFYFTVGAGVHSCITLKAVSPRHVE